MRWIGKALAGLAGLALLTTPALAQEQERGLYAGIGLEQFRLDANGTSDGGADFSTKSRPVGLTGRAGFHVLTWLAVEGFASFGIHTDEVEGNFGGGEVRNGESELEQMFGAALKPQYRTTFGDAATMTFYGLVGYADFEFEGEVRDNNNQLTPQRADFTVDDNSEYYGAGLQLDGDTGSLTFQYVRYADDDSFEVDGVQIGVNVYF